MPLGQGDLEVTAEQQGWLSLGVALQCPGPCRPSREGHQGVPAPETAPGQHLLLPAW